MVAETSSDLFETFSPLLSGELGNTFPCRRFLLSHNKSERFMNGSVFSLFVGERLLKILGISYITFLDAYMLSVMTVCVSFAAIKMFFIPSESLAT